MDSHDWPAFGQPERKPRRRNTSPELQALLLNEDGLASAFAEVHGGELRYDHHAQSWYTWTGAIWQREETRLAFAWARELCRERARDLPPADKARIILGRASTAGAVDRFAQADRVFAVTSSVWDTNGWLLGTPGGTVDLRTGQIRPPDPADMITRSTSVAPAPLGTPHPVWSAFLDQATNHDRELQAFLQRFVGYCLTGDVSEEVLGFIYGTGGTGKGTFLSAIVGILGSYATTVPIELFTASSRVQPEYYRAKMAGSRLVTASETEIGATWTESQIKEITGNEAPISARHPYGKPFSYYPTFKILLVGNNTPRLKGDLDAMKRRLRIAPFKRKPDAPDPTLKARLREEWPAILAWAIDGCLMWQEYRLGTCTAIEAETSDYFARQDLLQQWLDERCKLDPILKVAPSALQADYANWMRTIGEIPMSAADFRQTMETRPGIRYVRNGGTNLVRGIGLNPPPDERRWHD